MTLDPLLLLILAAVLALLVLLWRQNVEAARLRLAVQQALAGQRADGDSVRSAFQSATADTAARIAALDGTLRLALTEISEQTRQRLTTQFEATRTVLEAKLTEIQRSVNEQLHAAVEKQMTDSFARVIDQFTAVQKSMAEVARITNRLFPGLKVPLQTTQLILIHHQPISISFRKDERRFDVEGSYNIRYEVMKKRIDKACIKDTGERLTQPGKIAMVYTNQKEAQEYEEYIRFLQSQNYLSPNIEYLDLEELQGLRGLKALRVEILL